MYLAEYTDTFGGEANYCWVRRAYFDMPGNDRPSNRQLLRKARASLGLSGARGKIVADYGDELHWIPRGCCTILMVRWDEYGYEQHMKEQENADAT